MQTLMTTAWVTTCLWRGIRWDRRRRTSLPTQATGACGAFALTVLPFGPVVVHHSGWIAALALNISWIGGPGYYGTASPLGRRLARLALPVAAATITGNLVLGVTCTDSRSTVLRHLLLEQVVILGLATGMALLAGAGARVVRGRPRASLVLLAVGTASAAESALVNIQTSIHGSPGSPALLASLHTVAELACLAGLLLPLAPRRSAPRSQLDTARALESLWRLLAPGQAPIRIDDEADRGTWTFDGVISIRDRLAELQQLCPHTEFELAHQLARRDRHGRQVARAIAAARCLQVALRAEAAGHPPVTGPVNLLGMGGGRWLDHEVSWLAAVYRELRRLIPPCPSTATNTQSSQTPWTDPQLVQQCEQRLAQWFPGPLPATISTIRAAISQRRDRPIGVTITDNLPARALVATTADVDLVFLDRQDTPFMRIVNQAHELGHLICGHTGSTLTTAARSVRCRCTPSPGGWAADPIETEAEIIGRLIARHLIHAPGAGLAAYLEER